MKVDAIKVDSKATKTAATRKATAKSARKSPLKKTTEAPVKKSGAGRGIRK